MEPYQEPRTTHLEDAETALPNSECPTASFFLGARAVQEKPGSTAETKASSTPPKRQENKADGFKRFL